MQVEVVTPVGAIASRSVDEITAPGALGEMGILPGHIALLSGLKPGVVTLKGQGPTEVFAVGEGFVQVSGTDKVVLLTDRAVRASDVDTAAAQKLFAEAEKALGTWDRAEDEEHVRLVTQRNWASAQLAAAAAVGAATRH
jgi:F-type H+-transporting ATPase subunit epsilon